MNTASDQTVVDYHRIASAIEFISERVQEQPSLDEIAAHLHLSPFHFQRLFSRWAGITPKQFLQVITLERAKQLLAQPTPLLETSEILGLSSSSRLYDHFVSIEAATPGEFKRLGKGIEIQYGLFNTSFGQAFAATTERGICKLSFPEPNEVTTEIEALKAQWPNASLIQNNERIETAFDGLFDKKNNENEDERQKAPPNISLHVSGTNFQINVWKSLLRIPEGSLTSYTEIAAAIGKPKAVRAVGAAIGANPIGYLIPCHRVIRQSGALGGYRWGLTRKQALLAWESSRHIPITKG